MTIFKIKSPILKTVLLTLYVGIVSIGFIWNTFTLFSIVHKCVHLDETNVDAANETTDANGDQNDQAVENEADSTETEAPQEISEQRTGKNSKKKCLVSTHFFFNLGLFGVYMLSFLLMLISYLLKCCVPLNKTPGIPNAHIDKALLAELLDDDLIELVHPASNSLEYYTVERLIQNTWLYHDQGRLGIDSRCLRHKGIKVKTVFKVRNPNLWKMYKREQLMMNGKVLCKELIEKPILTDSSDIMKSSKLSPEMRAKNQKYSPVRSGISLNRETDLERNESETISLFSPPCKALEAHLRKQLQPDETYLFHGTKVQNVQNIIKNGFDHNKYSKAGLYGKAMYFAESSEKADQYADPINSRRSCDLTILVVRVLLGTIHCHEENTPVKAPYRGVVGMRTGTCDSYVTAIKRRFREFLVFDTRQCYPEYVVLYDRVYK